MGKNQKYSLVHKTPTNNISKNAHKIQLFDNVQLDLQEFAQSAKEKIEFLSSSFVNHAEELSHIKKQMFNFKSELDKFINKFIGLEQQVKKNAETILRYETKPNANCDRQCNIIIHGCEYYSAKTAMEETTDFLSNCLEVDVTVEDVRPLSNEETTIPEFLEQKKIGNKVYFRGADLFVNGTQITEEIRISPYHSHSVTAQTKPTEKTEKLDHAKCGQPPVEKDVQPEKDDQSDTHCLEGPHLKDVKRSPKLFQPISDDGVAYILSIMDANMKSLTREMDACLVKMDNFRIGVL
ncbi:hypothetical protein Fcan01_26978 [Folsomia candida]|uniref:Uncharacterized protein n=1 Tax=Folsomia candida TaxID=158441 RepID=A0A226CZJ2_FOLCA|nr:hypothetical protein Fcan01_26978 [Folsomia candida]